MRDLRGDGGILKTIVRQGDAAGGTPPDGATVRVHYVGTLVDGTKFDSSRDRGEKFKFDIGRQKVIRGWEVGVGSMHKGEVAILECRHDYAYGKGGHPPKIPPLATLRFEVELFDWALPSPPPPGAAGKPKAKPGKGKGGAGKGGKGGKGQDGKSWKSSGVSSEALDELLPPLPPSPPPTEAGAPSRRIATRCSPSCAARRTARRRSRR